MSDSIKNQTVEVKLLHLFKLQSIDSQIDEIRILRGELPIQVKDLEDEIAGLQTRIDKIENENKELKKQIAEKDHSVKESNGLIEKYEKQQNNVRNNREFDALNKEIEFQKLEIELSTKRIKEYKSKISDNKERIDEIKRRVAERNEELTAKKAELASIVSETSKEEAELVKTSEKLDKLIEPRLLVAYKRIRGNVKNKLAIVSINRDSCGGCFAKIPPQRQLDISTRKKIIVCEHCGRILVDAVMIDEIEAMKV